MRMYVVAIVCLCGFWMRDTAAGALLVHNLSSAPASCTVDGYDRAQFSIQPGALLRLPIPAALAMIDHVSCGANLRTRGMHITPKGPDETLYLNGQQTRTLNVLLYSSIPTDPLAGFTALLQGLTLQYQSAHPEVLLNLVLNPDIDTYNFDTLRDDVVGKTGYDIAELDTVFLTYLAKPGLIAPVTISGDAPLDVGKQAATVGNTLYGVPSWLCSDFAFSFDARLASVTSVSDLQALLRPPPNGGTPLVGDFDGSWTIPAMYLQAYAQTYGTQKLRALESAGVQANVSPPDPVIIKLMTTTASLCGSDACINNYYHQANKTRDGSVEHIFASGYASGDVGFSERTFFIDYYESNLRPLSLIPYPWGSEARLVYSDAFVTNKNVCGTDPCLSDSAAFTAWATSAATKAYIAFSGDLPAGSPPRHLLAATQPFWNLKAVLEDPIYTQVASTLMKGKMQPYINSFTPQLKYDLLSGLCPAVKVDRPKWACKVPPAPPPKGA